MPAIITVSERKEDIQFGAKVALLAELPFVSVDNHRKLRQVLKQFPDAAIFWDADHPRATDVVHPLSISNVGQALRAGSVPERVFVFSSEPLNKSPFIFNMPVFNHHIYRQYPDPAAQIVASLAEAAILGLPFGLTNYVPSEIKPKKVILRTSGERRLVLDAVEKILHTLTAPSQLKNLAVQTTDEMIMNAIFDAPCREGNNYYRRKTERSEQFPFAPEELIELELAFCKTYFAICVRDQFGSLRKDSVLQYIRKDYEKTEYKLRSDDPGAGLGIYGIVQSGMSLLFASQAGVKTEVTLFVPVVKSMKNFRTGFRFFSFM